MLFFVIDSFCLILVDSIFNAMPQETMFLNFIYFYRFSLLIFFFCVNFFSTKINHVLYLSTINLGIFFGSNKIFSLSHKI